jgi:hypothetical protein
LAVQIYASCQTDSSDHSHEKDNKNLDGTHQKCNRWVIHPKGQPLARLILKNICKCKHLLIAIKFKNNLFHCLAQII